MCAHYEATTHPDRLRQVFGVNLPDQVSADVWPGHAGVFIRHPKIESENSHDSVLREAMAGAFGLIPHWAKDTKIGKRTYNARSETVASKPSYRDAWRLGRRCIIPAEAFYEPDWRSGRAVATRISRNDGQPLGIAGIWTGWRAPDGRIVRSMSMLTINADEHPLMRQFHRPEDEKRMVVILDECQYDDWLDPSNANPRSLLLPFDADRLTTSALMAQRPQRSG